LDVNARDSSFQSVILELLRGKLNMMLSETFQLKGDVDFDDFQKLTKIILKEIARENINSVHLTTEEAKKAIKILDLMNCRNEIGKGLNREDNQLYSEDNNPFSNGPF
jgi:hypothetical protein